MYWIHPIDTPAMIGNVWRHLMSYEFQPTEWTVILHAKDGAVGGGANALEHLCHAYWKPLFAYVRSQGASYEDAEDTIQSFFRYLIESQVHRNADRERGRFRTFLLISLRHFISRQHRDAGALKRGGGNTAHLTLDPSETSLHGGLTTDATPDALFDKKWAFNVLDKPCSVWGRNSSTLPGSPPSSPFCWTMNGVPAWSRASAPALA